MRSSSGGRTGGDRASRALSMVVLVTGDAVQTAGRQFDGLTDLGEALGGALNRSVESLWKMQNGYALCTRTGLDLAST